jgi:ABC-type multidrug transport system fused ATPase/permease subunit
MNTQTNTTATEAAYTGSIPNTPMRFLAATIRPYWVIGFFGILATVLSQVIAASMSLFIGRYVDVVTISQDTATYATWGAAFVVLNILLFLFVRISGFVSIPLALRQNEYAFSLLKKYLFVHSNNYFGNRFAGSVTNKLFNAADRSSELLLMTYFGFVKLSVSLIVTGVILVVINGYLALVYLLVLLIAIGINIFLTKRRRPYVVDFAASASRYRGQVTDVITNIQAVRQYVRAGSEFSFLNTHLLTRNVKDKTQWSMAEWNHVINNVLATILLVSMVGGSYLLLTLGLSTIGEMIVVMLLMYRVVGIMVDLGDWMNRFVRVYGEVEEGLNEVLLPHEIVDTENAPALQTKGGRIDWNNVTFEFGNNAVFDNFDLAIAPGQRVGLVGPSGAGKTTFVSLLLRQHDIHGGAIEIDGQNIADITQDSLREHIAIVPQEPLLFHRSIRENIAYGNPSATTAEIEEVAKKAQAHDFIMDLEEGYDTTVGERGVKLSGGQKQRVAIARAMLKNAPILVLDEATSALDSESEVKIQMALQTLMEGKTVIAVAHRLSTLRKMDRILVLEAGKIVEDGPHDELAQNGGTYQRLWEHQAGGFLKE